jgi:Alpha/beta hydrolase domain
VTKAERERTHDRRITIEERYGSRTQYERLVTDTTTKLLQQRYLLTEDAPRVVDRTLATWDELTRGTVLAGK